MTTVANPAARSLIAITSFLFNLSTKTPAMGLKRTAGRKIQKPTRARAVAFPVISHAQNIRAKFVMELPSIDTTWPIHRTIKWDIPEGFTLFSTGIELFHAIKGVKYSTII